MIPVEHMIERIVGHGGGQPGCHCNKGFEAIPTRTARDDGFQRLAVILCHARRDPDLKGLQIECDAPQRSITLRCRTDWAASYPQSAHLLREEMLAWQKTPWQFIVAA